MTLALRASWVLWTLWEKYFCYSNSIPDVIFLDNLISWMQTNAGEITIELNSSQLQHHPGAHSAMLVPTSYCEPTFKHVCCIILCMELVWCATCTHVQVYFVDNGVLWFLLAACFRHYSCALYWACVHSTCKLRWKLLCLVWCCTTSCCCCFCCCCCRMVLQAVVVVAVWWQRIWESFEWVVLEHTHTPTHKYKYYLFKQQI